jgi:hypothetical protein
MAPSTWAAWPAREDEASAPCPRSPATMCPSCRLTRAPSWGSGERVGKLTHWSHPGGGESSSGTSTTSAREPPAGTSPCATSTGASTRASVAAGA